MSTHHAECHDVWGGGGGCGGGAADDGGDESGGVPPAPPVHSPAAGLLSSTGWAGLECSDTLGEV
eukprot:scaffold111705_cov21-Phaeocystis_antarctica.AAC.1